MACLQFCFGGNQSVDKMKELEKDSAPDQFGTEDEAENAYKKGIEAEEQKRNEVAIRHFKTAIAVDSNRPEFYSHLAFCLQEIGELEQAMEHYKKVVTMSPENHVAWYNLGYIQEELQEYDSGIISFEQAIKSDRSKDALINLGNCLMGAQRFPESIEMYREALTYDTDCEMCHYNLAMAYHSIEDFEKARRFFLSAIKLKPQHADAYFNLGICYEDEGKFEEAKQMYMNALQINPDLSEAQESIDLLNNSQHELE